MPPRLTPRPELAHREPLKTRACARSYRLTHGQVNYQPCHANRALLVRASSIDVDARLTPLDPPGKPAVPGKPDSLLPLTGTGLRHDRIPRGRRANGWGA